MLFRLAGPMKDKCFVLLSFFFFAPSSDFTANGLSVLRKQHPNLANGRSREVYPLDLGDSQISRGAQTRSGTMQPEPRVNYVQWHLSSQDPAAQLWLLNIL